MRLWRFVHQRHVKTAFTGEGTRLHGSRWVSQGREAVYLSDSAAQAVLETLVRLDDVERLADYRLFSVEVPEDAVADAQVPNEWRETPAPRGLQDIGDAWLDDAKGLALRVPCVLVPGANVLLDPRHEAFGALRPQPVDWVVDPRLAK